VRELAALSLVGAVCGVLGGVIFWAIHGGTLLTRSIAYGLWFAATVILVLTVVAGRKLIWRRTSLPVLEGWVFVSAAIVLTAAGAAIDAIGS
jgi:uncharacterized membrane protein (UPF0136 family)